MLASAAEPVRFGFPPGRTAKTANDLRQSARRNLITIPIQLNGGRTVPFALDSGASSTIIDERLAATLHLPTGKTVIGQGAGTEACLLRELVGLRVRTGESQVDSPVFAASLEPLERFVSLRMNGVVGGSLFLHNVISMDYRTRKARLLRTAPLITQPQDKRILVMQSGPLCCVVDAQVEIRGSRRPARLLIDTGALPFEMVLTRQFAAQARFPLEVHTELLAVPGLCGMSRIRETVGMTYIPGLPPLSVAVFIALDNSGLLSSANFDGVIGGELLRRFGTVIFDARNHHVLFRRG